MGEHKHSSEIRKLLIDEVKASLPSPQKLRGPFTQAKARRFLNKTKAGGPVTKSNIRRIEKRQTLQNLSLIQEALKPFNILASLNPKWSQSERNKQSHGTIYLSPHIHIKKMGAEGFEATEMNTGHHQTYAEAILREFKITINNAQQEGYLLAVNPFKAKDFSYLYYAYDPEQQTFSPYEPQNP